MFRERSFVLGLGLGIIAGVLLLQLMLSADVQQEKANLIAAEVSGTEKQPAAPGGDGSSGIEELDRLKSELAAQKQEHQQALQEALDKQRTELEEGQAVNTLIRAVTIRKGMGIKEVASLLEDAALIKEASAFLQETQLDRNRIRNGKYYFSDSPDQEEIKKILLRDPLLSKPGKK
ncbi:hypothetical protein [Paenibacillus pinihumi]|uniref:hypothetical protein n=1 Tax=Paenibacillus pinihumi TaxID=669462 RepID=UPI0003F6AF06|nr:hypothetical protein [Paenibacillus pinihumi]